MVDFMWGLLKVGFHFCRLHFCGVGLFGLNSGGVEFLWV